MRIKLDENVPARVRPLLAARGHDVDTVMDEQLQGQADDAVWRAAQRDARFLITQDLDFSDVRQFQPGRHHGILLVRLQNPGANRLVEQMQAILNEHDLETWSRCFVVLTERKLRIKRP